MIMLQANELMIGDLVYNTHNQRPEQVCEIRESMVMLEYNDLYGYDEIEPIPLTPEILEKNGFINEDKICDLRYYQSCGDIIGVDIRGDIGYLEDADLKYVHRLQHALCICGIEKEIVL